MRTNWPADCTNVLLVGGPLHGARMSVEHLPMRLVLEPSNPKLYAPQTLYVHQYETFEAEDAWDRHMVSVYAPPDLSHSEIFRLATQAIRHRRGERPLALPIQWS